MFSLQAADRLRAACAQSPPQRDGAGEIVALSIGLLLTNESRRALDYEVLKVAAEIEGCSAAPPMAASETCGAIAPGTTRGIEQELTLDRPLLAGMVLRGTVQAVVGYGAPNRPHRTLELDFAVSFKALSSRDIAIFRWCAV